MAARFQRDANGRVMMNPTLYAFADAYFNAVGRERTYRAAAIAAGAPLGSANASGCQWAALPCVREYWAQLDTELNRYRRSVYKRVLDELVELGIDKIGSEEEWPIGANILQQILRSVESSFNYRDVELSMQQQEMTSSRQSAPAESTATLATLDQIASSLAALESDEGVESDG